jgi:tRNA-dihydrouridine synthase
VHGRTAAQSYTGESDWSLISRIAADLNIPVFGSGDCVEASHVTSRLSETDVTGVLVGRGALRNPWIFHQAAEAVGGRAPRQITIQERGQFLIDYLELLLNERVGEEAGFRHEAPGQKPVASAPARGRERWVINKLRALNAWYSKGIDNGSRFRVAINSCESIQQLRDLIAEFFAPAHVTL